jgi:uncharacterized protein YlxW (UPF0749 family)
MKKIFVLSMLVSFMMICACQKQDSAAEQQLAQRKVELDAREEASAERLNSLEEKVNSLDQSVKALAGKQKDTVNAPANPTDVQAQAQVQAERDLMIQQLPTPSQLNAAEKQRRLEAAGVIGRATVSPGR